MIDISNAKVVSPEGITGPEAKAITVLIEEVYKRTGIHLSSTQEWPESVSAVIVAGTEASLKGLIAPYKDWLDKRMTKAGPEGYRIAVKTNPRPTVFIVGTDARGVLYGVGKLMRKLVLKSGYIAVDADLAISSTPRYPLRGHQLGYRAKTNAYDAWPVEQFEQYIRDLAIFGANSIEILPPRTDDAPSSPLMKLPPMEMMEKLSQIIDSYGLDVWIWYPNMGDDYESPEVVRVELAEREEIFSRLPRIDAVFIPGGDPGRLEPDELFQWSEKVAEVLHKYHPKATVWLSPQMFNPTKERLEAFYANVKKRPEWLGGIVFGPWVRTPLPKLRSIIPSRYPIRNYPDITHSLRCQYPVPDWDRAFALTLGRECINPRPLAEKHIHNITEPYTIGSISYSEGINDDVNKFIWSDQDWDPNIPVIETLRDFARFFIGYDYTECVAQGLMTLEENWRRPLMTNEGVEVTLRQWQTMESQAPDSVLNNYRFEMGLLRAYYDAYIRRRLIYETDLENRAMDALRAAPVTGSLAAIEKAKSILNKAKTEPVFQDYRRCCDELADRLFEHIGEQLTVKRHGAISWDRGAFMDAIDIPLNDERWLSVQFKKIEQMNDETERLKAIDAIVHRTDPGPGGFYDNFSCYNSRRRVCKGQGWEKDPGYLSSALVLFNPGLLYLSEELQFEIGGIPLAWVGNAAALYDTPLTICYDNIDPEVSYKLRITYIGSFGKRIRLMAGERYMVHDFIDTNSKQPTREFDIPQEAVAGGHLKLTWTAPEGDRGVQVAELWLIRKAKEA